MTYFTTNSTNATETVTISKDYIGGVYNNYVKPSFQLESVVSAKQLGLNISYTLQDIDGDGFLELIVGDLTGVVTLIYYIEGITDFYQESIEITINSTGVPNNYFETKNYPILSINSPASGVIEGSYKNIVRVGTMTGKIEIDYNYDSGEINDIAKQIKNKIDENDDLQNSILTQKTNMEYLQKEINLNNKYLALYNRAYDFQKNDVDELLYMEDEKNTIGTWTYIPSASTYYYMEGDSTTFFDRLSKELSLNREQISTYSLLGNYYQEKALQVTTTSSPSGNYSFYTVDKITDGLNGENYSFQSDSINPITINLELDSLKYLTKILDKPLRLLIENSNTALKYNNNPWTGTNFKTGDFGDMYEMGVIDPFLVTKTVLQNAVYAASLILTTNSLILLDIIFFLGRPGNKMRLSIRNF
jgi:hypothetical protein